MSRDLIRMDLRSLRIQFTFEIDQAVFDGRQDIRDLRWIAQDALTRVADCVEQAEQVVDAERRERHPA